MAENDIAYVVPCHNIAMHVRLALLAIQSADLDLRDKLLARGVLFRSVVLVHSHNDIHHRSCLIKQENCAINRAGHIS
jgi:hypothetical protein